MTATQRKRRSRWIAGLRRQEAEALAALEADDTLDAATKNMLLACSVTVDQFLKAFDLRPAPRTKRRRA